MIVLTVAACGGDDDNTKTAAPTATQTESGGSNTSTGTQTAKVTATPAGTSSNGAVDACSLLTTDEISAAISETASEGKPTNNAPSYECEWDNADETTVVYLTLYTNGREDAAQSEYDILDSGSEAVDGLGDKAHWVSIIGTLEVLKGSDVIEIQVVDFKTGSDAESEAKALAPKALDRLP